MPDQTKSLSRLTRLKLGQAGRVGGTKQSLFAVNVFDVNKEKRLSSSHGEALADQACWWHSSQELEVSNAVVPPMLQAPNSGKGCAHHGLLQVPDLHQTIAGVQLPSVALCLLELTEEGEVGSSVLQGWLLAVSVR